MAYIPSKDYKTLYLPNFYFSLSDPRDGEGRAKLLLSSCPSCAILEDASCDEGKVIVPAIPPLLNVWIDFVYTCSNF